MIGARRRAFCDERYEQLCARGLARPAEVRGEGYFYPDPAYLKTLFHPLPRTLRSEATRYP